MDSPTRREAATPWIRVGLAPDQRMYWVRRARLLAWFTIGYNLVEGIAGITFGIADESLALLGFGVDSFIEMSALPAAVWVDYGQAAGHVIGDSLPCLRHAHP